MAGNAKRPKRCFKVICSSIALLTLALLDICPFDVCPRDVCPVFNINNLVHAFRFVYLSSGSPVEVTIWSPVEPNNSGGKENCVDFNIDSPSWNDNDCTRRKRVVLCEQPCPVGWKPINDNCYRFNTFSSGKSFEQALAYCSGMQARLFEPRNAQTNLAVSQAFQTVGAWLGMKRDPNNLLR